MYLRHRLSLVLVSFILAGAASAYPEYKVTVVGPADSTAADINNAGVVVGYYPYSPTANHAFLNRGCHIVGGSDHLSGFIWRGKKMQSLNALINPASGWDIRDPRAINDAGQIAANAYRNGVRYAVRLDLIKPHVDAVPPAEHDEVPSVEAPLAPQAAAKRAQEEADGIAKEVAKPVAQ